MPNDATRDDGGLLLTAEEVAAELRTSTEYVRRLWRKGEMPSLVLNGIRARRMRRADLVAWIDDQPDRSDTAA